MGGRLLAYMVKKTQLTPGDLAKLRELIDEQAGGDGAPADAGVAPEEEP
jgi:hypothetical protein